jgi:hypothetical protein
LRPILVGAAPGTREFVLAASGSRVRLTIPEEAIDHRLRKGTGRKDEAAHGPAGAAGIAPGE